MPPHKWTCMDIQGRCLSYLLSQKPVYKMLLPFVKGTCGQSWDRYWLRSPSVCQVLKKNLCWPAGHRLSHRLPIVGGTGGEFFLKREQKLLLSKVHWNSDYTHEIPNSTFREVPVASSRSVPSCFAASVLRLWGGNSFCGRSSWCRKIEINKACGCWWTWSVCRHVRLSPHHLLLRLQPAGRVGSTPMLGLNTYEDGFLWGNTKRVMGFLMRLQSPSDCPSIISRVPNGF